MSKTIKQSVDSLDLSVTSFKSSLNKCKTSIKNKGVSVPSSTTFSGLPALIDKIQTKEKYELILNLHRFGATKGNGRNYYLELRQMDEDENGSYYSPKYYTVSSRAETITITDLDPGNYEVHVNTKGLRETGVFFGRVSVGPVTKSYLNGPTLVFTFSDCTNISCVQLYRSKDGPTFVLDSDKGKNHTSMVGSLEYFEIGGFGLDDLSVEKQGVWSKYTKTDGDATAMNDFDFENKGQLIRYPALYVFDIDVSKKQYTVRTVGPEGLCYNPV